jgi:hypothetical protein
MTDPEESFTTPTIDPVVSCPKAAAEIKNSVMASWIRRRIG